MRFPRPSRRALPESIVPMINVVFLLLIFFLMTAQIAPPEPFKLDLPAATPEAPSSSEAKDLWLSETGEVGFAGALGPAAWAALASHGPEAPLTIRADRRLPAKTLAQVLNRLSTLGIRNIDLAVRQ